MIDWHARFYDALPFSKDVKFKRSLQLELLLEPKKSLKARVTTNRESHTHTHAHSNQTTHEQGDEPTKGSALTAQSCFPSILRVE